MSEIEEEGIRRTVRVNTRLQPEVKSRLDAIAQEMGMPASTLAAVAICEYVQKKTLERQMLTTVHGALTGAVREIFSGLDLNGDQVASFVKALGASQEG